MTSERYALELPSGEIVTITATPEILAMVARVKAAMDAGERPDPHDLVALFRYLSEDT